MAHLKGMIIWKPRTLKSVAFGTGIGLAAVWANAGQLADDPSKYELFDTFVLEWNSTVTASAANAITVQNTIMGYVIIAPSPIPDYHLSPRITDVSSGSWFEPAT